MKFLSAPRSITKLLLSGSLVIAALAHCAPKKDLTEANSKPVVVQDPKQNSKGTGAGYEYVVRKPLGTIALAESRGLAEGEGAKLTDTVANAFEPCAEGFLRAQRLASGAVRVVGQLSEDGHVNLNVSVEPASDDVARNAILCVITPVKQFLFSSRTGPGADAGTRGFALEALWDPPSVTAR